ncbi:MAG: tRNA preQ1(34) S-adenosylmethionine ribosyltransferase-isomerase QueA [Desulfovibrio sp.]|nr:tRNA preQ1(34) S-adenosylmethionine ribosyltransferase-isomerase QueA [Desulfovibrio sp.]
MTDEKDYLLTSYDFELPPERIAQFPPAKRGDSRLLVMPRKGPEEVLPELIHTNFSALPNFLPKDALLVVNNSRVLQARLLGQRSTGGKVEFLLLTPLPLLLAAAKADPADGEGAFRAEAEGLLRCGARVRDGETFTFGRIGVTVLSSGAFGHRRVSLFWRGDLAQAFAETGHIPLPPYIRRADTAEDRERYQTVYARNDKSGSVAAPTAGLHFTPAMRETLSQRGIEWAEVTLYVGYGTFSPVRCEDIRTHVMHKEYIEIPQATADAVNLAKKAGRAVVCVGTTSLRTLEGVAAACGQVQAWSGWTDIFLYPGQEIRVADALITNFHLPESSLLMLVSAFAGRRRMLSAYREAVARGYRFFSYGDAMLIR